VLTFGIYATGIAAIVSTAVVFGIAASVEAGWRLYGRRDPEAIQDMGFPPPTARTGQDSFSIIVPAKDEVEVLHQTLETLARQTHQNVQIIATLIEGDDATIQEAEIARARYPDRIEILVRKYEKEMKPYQLNAALEICRGEYVGVIDAEDATATGLLVSVEAAFQTSGADVVQGPVQLMTLGMKLREWFMVHNVLEYLFWFSSRMMFQARHGFVPLGGNTVFIRRELLNKAGGWPISLTEDCALGVKLSTQYGAKVVAVYDPALATREETPDNVKQLLHQRIRWDTGFGMELLQKKWWHLPSIERRLLAWYILATPFLQASAGLLLPITLATVILIDAPVVLVLLTFLPYIPILLSLVLQFVGLHEFGRMFEQKVRIRHYLFLGFGFLPYQLILAWAALHAVLRIATGNMTWFKTAHSNKHRAGVLLPVMPMGEVA
jgi:cellulose synthase/poly-beta-1,6-N-acetylglucosamine synthase-like glycosyltransferase